MLGLDDFITIQPLVKRGVYLCDIAEQLGVHPKTVSRTVKRGGRRRLARADRTASWIHIGRCSTVSWPSGCGTL